MLFIIFELSFPSMSTFSTPSGRLVSRDFWTIVLVVAVYQDLPVLLEIFSIAIASPSDYFLHFMVSHTGAFLRERHTTDGTPYAWGLSTVEFPCPSGKVVVDLDYIGSVRVRIECEMEHFRIASRVWIEGCLVFRFITDDSLNSFLAGWSSFYQVVKVF